MTIKLDLTYLNELSGGDNDFIASILSTFIEESEKDIVQIEDTIATKDITMLGKLAHKNKSTLQLLGMLDLKELAFEIEQAAKKNPDNQEILQKGVDFVKYMKEASPVVSDELKKIQG